MRCEVRLDGGARCQLILDHGADHALGRPGRLGLTLWGPGVETMRAALPWAPGFPHVRALYRPVDPESNA